MYNSPTQSKGTFVCTRTLTHPDSPVTHRLSHLQTHTDSLSLPHTHTQRAAAGLAGKHQTPREEGGQAFPTFRLHGYFRCQAKNRANVNQTNTESTTATCLSALHCYTLPQCLNTTTPHNCPNNCLSLLNLNYSLF